MNTQIAKGVKNMTGSLVKNSPTILVILSVAGVFTTVVLAVSATPKALQLIAEEEDNLKREEELTPIDIIELVWKLYIPAGAMGLFTILCIVGAHSIHIRRNAALASVYSLAERTLREYQEKVIATIGKKKEEAIRDEINQKRLSDDPIEGHKVIVTGKGDVTCYETYSGRYFMSSMETIRKVVNDLNANAIRGEPVVLNDLFYELGLERLPIGKRIGWEADHALLDIRFSAKIATNGEPCLVIDYMIGPKAL